MRVSLGRPLPGRDDDPPPLPQPLARAAAAALALAAVLLLGWALAFLLEDGAGALVLLVLFAVVSLPALVGALLSAGPVLALLRGESTPSRTPACAGLVALGHAGVALVSLRPGVDRSLSGGDLVGGAVGALGLLASLAVLGLSLPGESGRRPVRVLLALSAGVLVLALVALRAVSQTG